MRFFLTITFITLVSACSSPQKKTTLRDIDVYGKNKESTAVFVKPKSVDEIRQAYSEYLKFSSKGDLSRLDALHRLAQLEFELSEKQAKSKGENNNAASTIEHDIQGSTLNRTIDLLLTSMRDYPNAKDNDKALYQLAMAYEQQGEHDKSNNTLTQLTNKYPKSKYYVESQFRLGENAFSNKKYNKAEDIYTEVIVSKKDNVFYEKALYKRGWARFKQEYYSEAVDDFFEIVNANDFSDSAKLSTTAKDQFNEYIRAIALCFSYMGGTEPLREYFTKNQDSKYAYPTYVQVSDIYLKQQRFTDAVETLNQYNKHFPKSIHVPEAHLKIIDAWKQSGFLAKAYQAIDVLYDTYHPKSRYWTEKNINLSIYNNVKSDLKDHMLLVAADSHKAYQTSQKAEAFNIAKKWYERYLDNYPSSARKDNIHYLYADLLNLHKDSDLALHHYELAAYDSDIILNKDAAYESIVLLARMNKDNQSGKANAAHLNKLFKYSLLYSQLYPNDSRTAKITVHAAEQAFSAGIYEDAIKLAELLSNTKTIDATAINNINIIKAHSYYRLQKYPEAEAIYTTLLNSGKIAEKDSKQLSDNLALSIYAQGTSATTQHKTDDAINHYARIADVVPASDIAATGLYDAITLAVNKTLWTDSIVFIKKFQTLYPNHKFSHDVSKKLSLAYLNSNQDINAAGELVKISRYEKDSEYKIAALWKAGELYESKKDYVAAITSFEEYANRFPSPYPQFAEAMYKLSILYTQRNDSRHADLWRKKIIDSDKTAQPDQKNSRTNFIASVSALALARGAQAEFSSIKLVLPLQQSLKTKKQAMQNATNLYGRASSYGVSETTTEATYAIAEIYRAFSKSLLESERPKNLNKQEQEQYKILLEDQAFPFEDKAIEFLETNMTQVKNGIYDEWIQKSLAKLKELFPTRYNREAKLDEYINVLH